MTACMALLSMSCIKEADNNDFFNKYEKEFANRTTVTVKITSEEPGEYVALYFANPYEEGSLVKQPALTGNTPITTTLDVPNDVKRLYVVSQGSMNDYAVGDLRISSASVAPQSRAYDTNPINAKVMTQVNSVYFPEKTNNVRGETLFKCTDLKIAETPADKSFEVAEVWLTFLGDGGCRMSDLYGKLWFYTYPAEKQATLTTDDCTFYGVKNNEVVEIPYDNIKRFDDWIFYTKEEFRSNIASYKRFKLGEFPKGLNIGFVYAGNSTVGNKGIRFTTPALNPRVRNFTLKYRDNSGSFKIEDNYLANGFICHITVGDFQGNILGMENRLVTENAKYDGDYNDIICLLESNPKTIKPGEDVSIGNSDKDEEEIACKTSTGLYLFEDNYPSPGDFDFNDAVIRYEIKDYYESKNKAKQITVETYAIGAGMSNEFGFRNANTFQPFLSDLEGYHNVYPTQQFEQIGEPVVQTLYGDITPYLKSGNDYYIYITNFNTPEYPCVIDLPLSDPDDATWHFEWPQETVNLDDCYYFRKNAAGNSRDKDWYKYPKDGAGVFQRNN